MAQTQAIKVFKGDDTGFNFGKLVTFNLKTKIDLSSFTGVFELGSYRQAQNLKDKSMTVNIPHEYTKQFPLGTMYGTFRLIDSMGRFGTVSNTIEFCITNVPFTPEPDTVELEVPEGYPVTIEMTLGFQNGDYDVLANKPYYPDGTPITGEFDINKAGAGSAEAVVALQQAVAQNTQDIASNAQAITNEAGAREQADTALQEAISAEETARTQADEALQEAITNEQEARIAADQALQLTVNANTQAIAQETADRTTADNTLQANIDAEAQARQTADNALGERVEAIEELIPTQATEENQLADKDFVNNTVGTNTAYYISNNGQPFTSLAELEAYSGTLTNNDYAFVKTTDADGNTVYNRYKYNANTQEWAFEYALNNSSFTAAQWAAIESGITAALTAQISTNESDIADLKANKQDNIADLATIRSGAAAGATALQPGVAASTYVPLTQKAAANGVATLDANKLVPAAQLPTASASVKGAVIVDTDLSDTSTNPVQNKVVKAELDNCAYQTIIRDWEE